MSVRISCGGLRFGDAFRWAVSLRKEYGTEPLDLVVGSFSRKVWEFVVQHTDLNACISQIIDEKTPQGAADYRRFKIKVTDCEDWPSVDRACDVMPYSGELHLPTLAVQDYYLVCLTTISEWKCKETFDLGDLKVKAIRFPGERGNRLTGRQIEWVTPKTCLDTYELLQGFKAFLCGHVGGMHVATFVGYNRIVCHHFMGDLPEVSRHGLGIDLSSHLSGEELSGKARKALLGLSVDSREA